MSEEPKKVLTPEQRLLKLHETCDLVNQQIRNHKRVIRLHQDMLLALQRQALMEKYNLEPEHVYTYLRGNELFAVGFDRQFTGARLAWQQWVRDNSKRVPFTDDERNHPEYPRCFQMFGHNPTVDGKLGKYVPPYRIGSIGDVQECWDPAVRIYDPNLVVGLVLKVEHKREKNEDGRGQFLFFRYPVYKLRKS